MDIRRIASTRFPIVSRGFDQDSVLTFINKLASHIENLQSLNDEHRQSIVTTARAEADEIRRAALADADRILQLVDQLQHEMRTQSGRSV